MGYRGARVAAAACLTVLVLAWAAPAMAGQPGTGPRRPGPRRGTSTNWSGYAVETSLASPQSGVVTDVHAHWTVTTVTATPSNAYSSAWVGIDGYANNTVEQIGTEGDWSNGAAVYYAWWEMYPKRAFLISSVPIHPGDVVSAEVQYAGNRRFVLTLQNLTTGATFSTTQKANAQRSSAEWIVEAPFSGGTLPLADFGTLPFSQAQTTINNHTGTISDSLWQYDDIRMVGSTTSNLLALPSALSTLGDAFSVTWYASN